MDTVIEATARALARDLDKRLSHILEPVMRRTLVRESLLGATPEVGCSLLAHLARNARRSGGLPPDALSDALHRLLVEPDPERGLPYDIRSDLYRIAHASGEEAVAAMLRSLGDRGLPEPSPPRELVDLPLGVRRSYARGSDPRMLEMLSQDHDRVVLDQWLANPRVTEADVIRLAASRPVARAALQAIYESDRWSIRPRVRVALAHNPFAPPEIAAGIVASLPLRELRAMRQHSDLPEIVALRLELELTRRDPRHVRGAA
jgi:hypothetical protein